MDKDRWRGKKFDDYYYVGDCGQIVQYTESFSVEDDQRYAIGNYYKCTVDAEMVRDSYLYMLDIHAVNNSEPLIPKGTVFRSTKIAR